jgi:mannose-6-phosphate isomerase-like protein (cupin superfamily)
MIITQQDAFKTTTEKTRGGEGVMNWTQYLNDANRPANTRIGMAAVINMPPGASLGFHVHDTNEELLVLIDGQALYHDNEHKPHVLQKGTVTLCRQGEGHSLANNGTVPLVFAAIFVDSGK